MAFYLVSAVPKHGRLEELGERLARAEFMSLRPFGATLSASLKEARIRKDGVAVWEEEDYCAPPLAQERAAVLDDYFHDLRVEKVRRPRLEQDRSAAPPVPGRVSGSIRGIHAARRRASFAASLHHGLARCSQHHRHHDRRSGGHGLDGLHAEDLVAHRR